MKWRILALLLFATILITGCDGCDGVDATPTPDSPIPSVTPPESPLPSDTPEPTDTAIPPTVTQVPSTVTIEPPTATPPDSPLPSETPPDSPLPSDTPGATDTPPAATDTPRPTLPPGLEQWPIRMAVEQQTWDRYGGEAIKPLIQEGIDEANRRLEVSGVNGRWYIESYAPVYDKWAETNCSPRACPGNGWLPAEYCNHSRDYVFVIADETNIQGCYNWDDEMYPSLQWHGMGKPGDEFQSLFWDDSYGVFAHEMGHMLGLPDLYHMRISSSSNAVNGEAFPNTRYNPWQNDIMWMAYTGIFSEWGREIIHRTPEKFPFYCLWHTEVGSDTVLRLIDRNGNPITGAVSVYHSNDDNKSMDAVPDWSSVTDDGLFHLGSEPFGPIRCHKQGRGTIRVYLVETSLGFEWFNFMDVSWAYWNDEPITLTFGTASQEAGGVSWWVLGLVALIGALVGSLSTGTAIIYWWNKKLGDEWDFTRTLTDKRLDEFLGTNILGAEKDSPSG